ncbi:MAG: hypothetical protein IT307_16860 [Chloroflexi bacterium]|nr:hypothetical protein [Chloroflexota bacterium]
MSASDSSPGEWCTALLDALADFKTRAPRASNRMTKIQELVRDELETRFSALGHLAETTPERPPRGAHRTKCWDVVFRYADRVQLAISTKSIMANVSGTVPNRIDDAMGECVNIHAHDPGMVLGYLLVMDATGGEVRNNQGRRWVDVFAESLLSFPGRRSEQDARELFEAARRW